MINIISTVALLAISVTQLNIFEIDGVFSSAHVRSIERHIDDTQYKQSDLLVVQYSSTKYSEEAVDDFSKLLKDKDFVKAMWVGPYSIEIDFTITTGFDIVGYVPGTEIINVEFTKQLKDKYCSVHTCDLSKQKITITKDEGIFGGHLVVGSLSAFLENINESESFSNDVQLTIKDDTFEAINFLKPSLIERFYISISEPIFTYMFFVLGFALIGLELFAIGPGIMAFIGGLLVVVSSLPFQEFGINYLGIGIFLVAYLIYLKILSRGYFSSLGIVAFVILVTSSIVMFSDYIVTVNNILLAFISIGLAFFYFIAIPTVIRSRLTTDTSAMTSYVDSDGVFIKKLDGNAVLVNIGDKEFRVESDPEKKYKKGSTYKIHENDGNLEI
jgi:membrane protein implicated in regulation of membrane protease activity